MKTKFFLLLSFLFFIFLSSNLSLNYTDMPQIFTERIDLQDFQRLSIKQFHTWKMKLFPLITKLFRKILFQTFRPFKNGIILQISPNLFLG